MIIDIVQIVSAIALIIVIVLQNRGAGLGAAFGGGEGNVYRTRRSAEKVLFQLTIILAVIFFVTAFVNILF